MPAFGRFAQQYGREMERGQRLQESITRLFGAVQRKQEIEQRRSREAHNQILGELGDPQHWRNFSPEDQAATLAGLNEHRGVLGMEPLRELPDPQPGAYADLVWRTQIALQKGIGVDPDGKISKLVFDRFTSVFTEDWLHRNNVDTHNRAAMAAPTPEAEAPEVERPPGAPEGRIAGGPAPEGALPVPTALPQLKPWRKSLEEALLPYVTKLPTRDEQMEEFKGALGAWVMMQQNTEATPEDIGSGMQRLLRMARALGLPYDEGMLRMYALGGAPSGRMTTAQALDRWNSERIRYLEALRYGATPEALKEQEEHLLRPLYRLAYGEEMPEGLLEGMKPITAYQEQRLALSEEGQRLSKASQQLRALGMEFTQRMQWYRAALQQVQWEANYQRLTWNALNSLESGANRLILQIDNLLSGRGAKRLSEEERAALTDIRGGAHGRLRWIDGVRSAGRVRPPIPQAGATGAVPVLPGMEGIPELPTPTLGPTPEVPRRAVPEAAPAPTQAPPTPKRISKFSPALEKQLIATAVGFAGTKSEFMQHVMFGGKKKHPDYSRTELSKIYDYVHPEAKSR